LRPLETPQTLVEREWSSGGVVLENTVVVGSKLHRYWHWGCGV
jgi:hypothetical protein